jgi:DNA sulfur modification protein DndD
MIIRSVKLHNFGIYGGDNTFDLMPQEGERYHRPIILFRGKNGVGKSTLVEAIRLCLHGRLSLGSRSKQREYEAYLKRRLHRSATGEIANNASIQLEFDHVTLGRRQQYRVNRSWESNGQRLLSTVHIWIDDVPLTEDEEEKEHLLRELVPPGVAELFFFDGEKIATLSEAGEASDALLSEKVRNLLGLHLVEQLDRDLDIYLTRQTGIRELKQYQDELEQLHQDEANYEQERDEIREQLADCRKHLNKKRQDIALLEASIAREGGSYAERQTAFEEEHQQLVEAITQVEQEIQELSRNALPFSVAPKLLTAVRNRLLQEAEYEQWQASQAVLSDIKQRIIQEVATEDYWVGVTDLPDEKGQEKHIQNISQLLQPYEQAPMPETEVVHRVSSEKRGVLLNWIDEALNTAPPQLSCAAE